MWVNKNVFSSPVGIAHPTALSIFHDTEQVHQSFGRLFPNFNSMKELSSLNMGYLQLSRNHSAASPKETALTKTPNSSNGKEAFLGAAVGAMTGPFDALQHAKSMKAPAPTVSVIVKNAAARAGFIAVSYATLAAASKFSAQYRGVETAELPDTLFASFCETAATAGPFFLSRKLVTSPNFRTALEKTWQKIKEPRAMGIYAVSNIAALAPSLVADAYLRDNFVERGFSEKEAIFVSQSIAVVATTFILSLRQPALGGTIFGGIGWGLIRDIIYAMGVAYTVRPPKSE